jgi:hypothetical protein
MAKTRKPDEPQQAGGSVSGYFKAIFKEHPSLVKSTSNEDIFARWRKDHPGEEEVPDRVKGILFNVKSKLRKKLGAKRGIPRKEAQPTVEGQAAEIAPTRRVPLRGLESLEERIDDCLTLARRLDREGLEAVIHLLRRARNEVVVKLRRPRNGVVVKLRRIANSAREALDSVLRQYKPSNTRGFCIAASKALVEASGAGRVVRGTFKGSGHAWVEYEDKIVDLTLDQFGEYPPVVFLDKTDKLRRFYRECDVEDMRESGDAEPLQWLSDEEWDRLPAKRRDASMKLNTTNDLCNAILTLLVKNHE